MARLLGRALLACLLCAFWALPARAAVPSAGIDCECDAVGNFLRPAAPEEIESADGVTGASPSGNFVVSAQQQPDGSALLTVTEQGSATPLLAQVPGVAWGFSPDEDERFVVYYRVAGLTYARVYNLVGASPATPVIQTDALGASGTVGFSPHGHYVVVMWLPSDGPDHFALRVLDARTGVERHRDQLSFASPAGLPEDDEVGSVRVGFGPDEEDRSFVYAWIAGNGLLQKSWRFVALAESTEVWGDAQNFPFTWGFSRCGDRFAVVWENTATSQKEVHLRSTLDFANLGLVAFPITSTQTLTTTSAQHQVVLVSEIKKLGDNLADAACVAAPAPVPAFSVGALKLRGIPIAFTDSSVATQGNLVAWTWSFGDGTFSGERNPAHTFANVGTYDVKLTVTNSAGRAASLTKSVVVAVNQLPVPSFTYSPMPPSSRDIVTFTSTSTDDDGIAAIYWSLGESTGSGKTFTTRVCAPSADVVLYVVDNAGQSAEVSVSIPVGGSSFVPVAPGESLQTAADGACPGDTLLLSAGTYDGGVQLEGINLEGAGRGQSIVSGAGETSSSEGYVLRLRSSRVKKLSITGGTAVEANFQTHGGGVRVYGDVSLLDVEIANNAGRAGVFLENNSDGVEIRDALLHHNEPVGIMLGCCGELTVARSEIAFHPMGVTLSETANVVFEHNDFHDNERALDMNASARIFGNRFYENGAAVTISGSEAELSGNLLVNNQRGIIGPERGRTIVTSSTIANNCELGVEAGQVVLQNSIVTGNGVNVVGTLLQGSAANLIGESGLFVSDVDFHLAPGSAAIDAGAGQYLPEWLVADSDGDPRSAAALDIGWDEWTPGQPSMALAAPSCVPSEGGAPNEGGAGGQSAAGAPSSEGGAVGEAGAPGSPNGGSGTTRGGTAGGGSASGGSSPVARGGEGGDESDEIANTSDESCSCRVGARAPSSLSTWLLGCALALWASRRRRRSRH